jgi:hypothetical protein
LTGRHCPDLPKSNPASHSHRRVPAS